MLRRIFITFIMLVLTLSGASATTYVIRADGTGDFPTIQAAIGAAPWGSVLELAPGVYSGDGNRDIHFHGKPLTICGDVDDPAACIIDCGGSQAEPHRAFIFDWAEGAGSVVQALTIRNGYATGAAPPDLESCGGGVVIHDDASPTFIDVVVRDCTAFDGGGVAAGARANPTFTRCKFIGNYAWWGGGGGLWFFLGSGTVTDCTFTENVGHQVGGGLVAAAAEALVVTGCLFLDNAVESGYGAGASVAQGSAEFSNSTFIGNHGLYDDVTGAGLEFWSSTTASVDRCTFFGNLAAPGRGAAISAGYGTNVEVTGSIVAGNDGGGAMYCDGGLFDLACCDIWGNAGGDWTGCISDQQGVAGNFSLDPLFCDVTNGDLSLQAQSPCAPEQNPECGLIGAWPVGCTVTGVDPATLLEGLALTVAPNPMSSTCRVSLRPIRPGPVTVEVVDVRGRVVRRLHDGPAAAAKDGGLALVWDGRDAMGRRLASGVYWLRARGSAAHEMRRIVMVR